MFNRILVPLDGSELAAQSMPVAREVAGLHGSTVHLVRVISGDETGGNAYGDSGGGAFVGSYANPGQVARNMETSRQLGESKVDEVLEYLEHFSYDLSHEGIEVKSEVLEGDADENIVSYAKGNDIDLIIMTSHGYGGIKRMMSGSVTDKVVRSGVAPVLVVPAISGE